MRVRRYVQFLFQSKSRDFQLIFMKMPTISSEGEQQIICNHGMDGDYRICG